MADTKKEKKEDVKRAKNNKLLSTQRYLQISSVRDDTVILKDGGIRAILEVSAVNFDLKSEEEQDGLIMAYQNFLNALDFPVQTLVRSRKLDIDGYLEMLSTKMENQTNDLLKTQMQEYIEYIQRLVESTNIMEKKFFVIIPQVPLRAVKNTLLSKFLDYISPADSLPEIIKRKKEFHDLTTKLDSRITTVKTGLENCGLSTRRMKTSQIIELFYQAYNPEVSRYQKLEEINEFAPVEDLEENLVEAPENPEELKKKEEEAKKKEKKPSKSHKWLMWVFIILLMVILIVGGFFLFWYWSNG